ncbi:MAG: putative membrane protein [Lysobacterales bacterium]
MIGISMSAGLLLVTKLRFSPRFDWIPNLLIYLLATLVTAVYVLTQGYELHNMGGK